MIVIVLLVVAGVFLFRKHASPSKRPDLRRVGDSKVFTPVQAPAPAANLPSGPSGYFIEAEPPAEAESEATFQLGTPQDRKAFEAYLRQELPGVVPQVEDFSSRTATVTRPGNATMESGL